MIRRHASTLRALLMLTDGLLAAAILVGLSIVRFGEDWAVWWREIIPDPFALLVMYAVGWEAMPEEAAAFVHAHPTLAEAVGESLLGAAGRSLH